MFATVHCCNVVYLQHGDVSAVTIVDTVTPCIQISVWSTASRYLRYISNCDNIINVWRTFLFVLTWSAFQLLVVLCIACCRSRERSMAALCFRYAVPYAAAELLRQDLSRSFSAYPDNPCVCAWMCACVCVRLYRCVIT